MCAVHRASYLALLIEARCLLLLLYKVIIYSEVFVTNVVGHVWIIFALSACRVATLFRVSIHGLILALFLSTDRSHCTRLSTRHPCWRCFVNCDLLLLIRLALVRHFSLVNSPYSLRALGLTHWLVGDGWLFGLSCRRSPIYWSLSASWGSSFCANTYRWAALSSLLLCTITLYWRW